MFLYEANPSLIEHKYKHMVFYDIRYRIQIDLLIVAYRAFKFNIYIYSRKYDMNNNYCKIVLICYLRQVYYF